MRTSINAGIVPHSLYRAEKGQQCAARNKNRDDDDEEELEMAEGWAIRTGPCVLNAERMGLRLAGRL